LTTTTVVEHLSTVGDAINAVQDLPPNAYLREQNYRKAATDIDTLSSVLEQRDDVTLTSFLNPAATLLRQQADVISSAYDRIENNLLEQLKSAKNLKQLNDAGRSIREASRMRTYPLLDEVSNWLRLVFDDLNATLNLNENNYAYDLGLEKVSERLVELIERLELRGEPKATRWAQYLTDVNQLVLGGRSGTVLRNPYVPGTVIDLKLAELFKGRGELAGEIAAKLHIGDALAFVLHGPRRMGKTSFLQQLPRLLPSEFVSITFDAQRSGATVGDSAFFYQLAKEIYDDLDALVTERNLKLLHEPTEPNEGMFYEPVEPIETGGSGPDDPVRLVYVPNPYSAFRKWLQQQILPAIGEDRYLFITIDEFESIGDALEQGDLRPRVLDTLRAIIQDSHFRQLRLMFAGVATIEQLAPPTIIKRNPFVNVTSFPMTYLDREAAINLIREPIPDKKHLPVYEDDAVEEILMLTRGQPFLIQAVCSVLFTHINQTLGRDTHVTADMVRDTTETVFERYRPYFANYWQDAGSEGQPILLHLAENPDTLEGESRRVVRELERRLIIEHDDQGVYTFQVPLFREWVLLYEM
jgi:hypothetical protein